MKQWSVVAGVCLFGLFGWCAEAQEDDESLIDSISIGGGMSRHNHAGISRIGIRKDAKADFFKDNIGWLDVYSEASVGYWDKGDDHVFVGAYSPVFIYYFGDETWILHPYIEAGIGVAGISKTEIAGRDMSTGFQFEDRIGVGVRMRHLDLSFRYMHYSNASIARPNDGMDIFILTAGYRF